VKDVPPGLIGERGGFGRRRTAAVLGGDGERGPLIARADGAGGEGEEGEKGEEPKPTLTPVPSPTRTHTRPGEGRHRPNNAMP
jgi:hypothetical protein